MIQTSDEVPAIDGLESGWVEVGGRRLHHWVGGPEDGEPVLLWHGFLGTGWSWREVAPALVRAGHRVLVVDVLGFGDSDKPAGTDPYAARALSELVRAHAAAVGVGGRPLLLVAHDMGAPPALLWSADHPDEVAGLVYAEAPTMLGEQLRGVIAYTPQAMAQGSMWWWVLPLAPGVPEALVVGREEQFLRWFYDGPSGAPAVFSPETVAQMLRTFVGTEGVLGSMGVYRAAFASIAQTEPLVSDPVRVPVVAVAGERGLGAQVAELLGPVTRSMTTHTIAGCGHFVAEEAPADLVRIVLDTAGRVFGRPLVPSSSTTSPTTERRQP